MWKLPLEGKRILDLTHVWAGPYCTAFLGGMGAEVIKLESIQRPDTLRFTGLSCDLTWELSAPFNCANVNKNSVTVNLQNPRGVEIFKELVKVCDVVIENFAPRAMENFNLTYPVLRDIKSDIIMVSMPAFGLTGPFRDHAGIAFTFEASSGVTYLAGYVDGRPQVLGSAADPIAGMHAAFAIVAALEYHRRTGKGQMIDLAQTEITAGFTGPALIDYSFNKRVWERLGNRDSTMVPHGVFRCKGQDRWVAIAVSSDDEWKAFCEAIGNPQLALDERFALLTDRWKNQESLDRIIETWTVEHDYYDAMAILQKAGVAAGAVTIAQELYNEPQLKARGFFHEMTRDIIGTQLFPTWPIRFSETPLAMRPAPKLGEHNEYVLGSILKFSNAEINELKREKIIGTSPVGFEVLPAS